MKKNVLLIVLAIVMSLGVQSCSDDKDNNTSRVQLILVDAPGDYKEVNVEIIDIQYNNSDNEEGWTSFTAQDGYPINVDLTELIAGNNLLLTDEIIPSGMLKQIRLVLSDNNWLVTEGEDGENFPPVHLETPSAQQSGLKLNLDTELEPGFTYKFIFDWDVQRSIVKTGSDKYILKPVIRVNAEVNSGSIGGKVTAEATEGDNINGAVPLEDVKVNVYTTEDVYVTESLTDENGDFIIQGLDEGDYKIKIEHNGYTEYVSETINVSVGLISDIGTIELAVPVSE
ncbi:MAG: DUF4382 domain-containing protein [Bacteroidota bacterium]